MSVTIDTSELEALAVAMRNAGRNAERSVGDEVGEIAETIRAEAAATAASYTKGDRVLAGRITVSGSGTERLIGSNRRSLHFLEYGSPSTGGPRGTLTIPAERGTAELGPRVADRLLEDL
jgi:hypothetical protein